MATVPDSQAGTHSAVSNLSADGGVRKLVLKEGDGPCPSTGCWVECEYVGSLADGTEFDRSHGYGFKFVLGKGSVIKGWELGLLTMRCGERARLMIRSDYGYGKSGDGDIPPDAELVFEVQLLRFGEGGGVADVKNSEMERLKAIRAEREAAAAERKAAADAKKLAAKQAAAARAAAKEGGKGGKRRGKKKKGGKG